MDPLPPDLPKYDLLGRDDQLRAKMRLCAYYIASGMTQENAARSLGISRRTIERWRKMPEFCEEVDSLHRAVRTRISSRYLGMANDALDIIADAMKDEEVDVEKRVGWAFRLLEVNAKHGAGVNINNTTNNLSISGADQANMLRSLMRKPQSELTDDELLYIAEKSSDAMEMREAREKEIIDQEFDEKINRNIVNGISKTNTNY